jgi:hypothetical protein
VPSAPRWRMWFRTGGRVAEGARLESVWAGDRLVGSNPTLSANYSNNRLIIIDILPVTES